MHTLSKVKFYANKKHLDVWVFWRESDGNIQCTQSMPNKHITKLLIYLS